jgi:outer membrane lipoprotein SlyB
LERNFVQMLVATLRGTAALALAAALAACAPQQSGDVLASNQALTAQEVQFGTVTGARNVTLSGGQGSQLAGAVVGGVAGAALGHEVGRGTGQDVATALGATAGVVAGQAAGRAAASAQSIEWFVRLDSGRNLAVIQGEPVFSVGQRVRVITGGGQTRLAPA